MSAKFYLFTDGSVNPQSKIGYGACLAVSELKLSVDSAKLLVKVKRFEDTSSTKLELQTLVWALSDIENSIGKVIVYTDSQNIIGLPGRRERLEKNDYRTKNKKLIANHQLYLEFYQVTDRMECEFVKVRGHKVSNQKNHTDQLFTLVDRASRNALRERG